MSFDITTYKTPDIGYSPEDWADEVIPLIADHPDKYLKVKDGKIYLAPMETPDDELSVEDFHTRILEIGQEVTFNRYEDFGDWDVTVSHTSDGGWEISGAEDIDEQANCFVADGDMDTFADTPHEALSGPFGDVKPNEGSHEISAYAWGDGKPWRLTLKDGAPHFIEVGGAEDVAH